MTAEKLTIRVMQGPHAALTLAGTLDLDTVNDLKAQARELLDTNCETLTIDAAAVDFCDSTGLAALVNIYKAGRNDGVHVHLHNPSRRLATLLTITGLTVVFPVSGIEQDGDDAINLG